MALVLVFRPYGLFSPAAAAEDLTMLSRADLVGALAFVAAAAVAPAMPAWLVSLATIAFANALVVLGLIILWRTGLVPFGQALFYAIGAYAVALIGRYTPVRDVFVVVLAGGVCAAVVAWLVGFLLARYREIFFAMLSLAMSMILYGVLVKTETLGSTDGFHVAGRDVFRLPAAAARRSISRCSGSCSASAPSRHCSSRSISAPSPARSPFPCATTRSALEFLGVSVTRLIHLKLVIAGDARRRRRRARGAGGRPCRSRTCRTGRRPAASCS